MSQHVCCPAGAWGELKNPDYVPKGVVEKAGDLSIYKVIVFQALSMMTFCIATVNIPMRLFHSVNGLFVSRNLWPG
jgi:hypothetical protein